MKKLCLLIAITLLYVLSSDAYGQDSRTWPDTLNVLVPFYFEDGVGNKDTVYIGFSDDAADSLNTHLGEEDLTGLPFDSVFEVRVAQLNQEYLPEFGIKYSGKIGYYDHVYNFRSSTVPCINYSTTRSFGFVVNIEHYPIKVSWDSSVFRDSEALSCISNSFITNNYAEPILDQWWEFAAPNDIDFKCLALQNGTHEFEPFDSRFVNSPFDPTGAFIVLPEEGSLGPDTMVILSLSLYYGSVQSPPCHDILASVPAAKTDLPFSVYPNPTSTTINLSLPEAALFGTYRYEIYSSVGRLVGEGRVNTESAINVSNLAKGMYGLRLTDEETWRTGMVKWMKR